MIRGNTSFFITGGTMGQDTPSYVERQADTELYEGLRRGEFCYVLTARQMGKSSLMVRTASRLREDGLSVLTLDLTVVGQNLTLEQWYYGLLNLAGRQLGLRAELRAFWVEHPELGPLQRFMLALEQVALAALDRPAAGLVVFVDEIDSVRSLPFSTDELFAAIRQLYNRRAEEPALSRITFCLLGVASPSQLIQDPRTTPFNVGHRIELHDFREAEARPLAVGLQLGMAGNPLRPAPVAQRLLQRVLYWTHGHPYLTQRLCQEVAENPKALDARAVDRICGSLFLHPGARNRDDNLLFVQKRLVNREDDVVGYLELYRRIRAGQRVRSDETDPHVPELRLSGIVTEEKGYLRVRNRIYRQVFDPRWVTAHLPDVEVRRQLAAYRRSLARGGVFATVIIAALGTFAGTALLQTRRAERILAEMQINRGVDRLETGDGLGLLDLVDAYQTARWNPELRLAAGQLWAGWQPVMQRRLTSMVGQSSPVGALCFSPRGHLLITGAENGTTQLWDTRTWRRTGPTFEHGDDVYSLSMDATGRRLITQGPSGVQWWEVATGRRLGRWKSRAEVCTAAAVSHRRNRLACADGLGVSLRSLDSVSPETRELPGRGILSLAFSADDRQLYVGKVGGLEVWNLTSRPESRVLVSDQPAEWLALAPLGQEIAVAGAGQARIWQLPLSSRHPGRLLDSKQVSWALFQPPDGAAVAALGRTEVRFHQVLSSETDLAQPVHPGASQAMAFNPDGHLLATAGSDGSVRIWETAPDRGSVLRLHHPAPILASSQLGSARLDSIAADGSWKRWDPVTGAPLGPPTQLGGPVDGATIDGEHGLAATWRGADVWLRSLDSGRAKLHVALDAQVDNLTFVADGGTALINTRGHPLRLMDCRTGELRGELPASTFRQRGLPRLSPDGRILAVSSGSELLLCDPHSGRPLGPALTHREPVSSFAFSGAGRLMATSAGSTVQLWNRDRRPFGRPLRGPAPVQQVALSGDGNWLATATVSGEVRCWRTQSQQPTGLPIELSERILHLLFDPQGSRLITVGMSTLRLWDVVTGRSIGLPIELSSQVQRAWFETNGGTLVLEGGRDLCLWRLPASAPTEGPTERAAAATLGMRRTEHGDLTPLEWQDFRRLRGSP